MWTYIIGSIIVAFAIVERIPRLRRYSPAQALIFQAFPDRVFLDDTGVKQLTVSKYSTPITYLHHPPTPSDENFGVTQGIVLYLHGNAGDIISASHELLTIQGELNKGTKIKYHAVALEYPGYGTDTGSCRVTDYCISDMAVTLLGTIAKENGIYASNIIVVGRSIGTGIAAQVASKLSVKALILISPFTRLKDAVRSIVGRVATCLLGERFDTVGLLPQIKSPMLCIHGKNDDLIPLSHSEELIRLYKKEHGIMIPGVLIGLEGGHNNINKEEIARSIAWFVNK